MRKTLQWEGVGGLYKGVTSPLAGQVRRGLWWGDPALAGGTQFWGHASPACPAGPHAPSSRPELAAWTPPTALVPRALAPWVSVL